MSSVDNCNEENNFVEFRRKVRAAEVLSAAMEHLLKSLSFSGRVSVVVQNGRVLKSGYEENRPTGVGEIFVRGGGIVSDDETDSNGAGGKLAGIHPVEAVGLAAGACSLRRGTGPAVLGSNAKGINPETAAPSIADEGPEGERAKGEPAPPGTSQDDSKNSL
jgi:hypothetical protein